MIIMSTSPEIPNRILKILLAKEHKIQQEILNNGIKKKYITTQLDS